MGHKTRTIPRGSALGNSTLRNAAAKLVAARFHANSRTAIPSKGAARIAGYSTVTVSGANAAGLDRCAYTLGKWQNSVRPARHSAGAGNAAQISSHFPDIGRKASATTTANRPPNADADHTVANIEAYVKRSDEQADRAISITSTDSTTTRQRLKDTVNQTPARAANSIICANEYAGEERRSTDDRRDFTVTTMWYCLRKPQRARGRRKSDARYPLLDVFDSSAMFLAVALTTLSLCDAFFTLNILAQGGQEVNPFMNYMLGFGTFTFVASKMLFTAVAVVALTGASNLKLFNRIRVRSIIATLIGLYAGLIAYELLILAIA